MSKKPVSLEAQLAGRMTAPQAESEVLQNVIPLQPTPSAKAANEKATVYLPRAAMKRIKQMALDQDKRINDLLQEGIDLMLAKYGQKSINEFER
jgi:hypothetical protein